MPLSWNEIRRPFLSAEELINGGMRSCLWLSGASPSDVRALPEVMKRVEGVRKHRTASPRKTTRELAKAPMLFGEIRQPLRKYLAIPKTSSERRLYIPMAFFDALVIASTELFTLSGAAIFYFGILSSSMHMAWVRQVCGRLKSDYRYSGSMVYNNFPWPKAPSVKQRSSVEKAAQSVLDARRKFPDATLADLYDPLAMPKELLDAHADLDRAVDRCYRPQPFQSDRQRVEYLFALYEELTAPLLPTAKKPRRKAPSHLFPNPVAS